MNAELSQRAQRTQGAQRKTQRLQSRIALAASVLAGLLGACREKPPADRVRVSGQIEATEVQVAAPVGGRILELHVTEGDRVKAGDVLARLDTADARLALMRARADRDQADAQYRLLLAGARPEDIREAEAQRATAEADVRAAEAELTAAQADADRFEALLASDSISRKQRDDAVTHRDVAVQRVQASRERVSGAAEGVARLRAGARREDLDAARARVAAASAQIATWEKAIADATIAAPLAGVVSEKLVDAGELLQPRAPVAVIADLDHVWANVYVDEPDVPRLRLGQEATVFTDADARLKAPRSAGQEVSRAPGGNRRVTDRGLPGTVSYISSKAEFTPRNVQTAEDRSKLVYRVKITVDNSAGALKIGMPIEAEIPFADAHGQ
jgi:HlyD family secretion protein